MSRKRRKIAKLSFADLILQIGITFFAILNLFPLYWMFSNTFKYSHEVSKMPPDWIPRRISFMHYSEIFYSSGAARWLFNSLFVSVVGTLMVVIISAMASYAFAKLNFRGRAFLYLFFVMTLMIPKESYIIPLFLSMKQLNMVNTYSSMILPTVALPFGVFLLKSFFDAITNSIRESAKIDGANEWRTFFFIMLPMAKAGLGALFILMFVRIWNDYLWQLLMAQKNEMKTLMVGIASIMHEERPDIARKLTGAAVSAIPMLIVFFSFQRFFTRGISIGAVKE